MKSLVLCACSVQGTYIIESQFLRKFLATYRSSEQVIKVFRANNPCVFNRDMHFDKKYAKNMPQIKFYASTLLSHNVSQTQFFLKKFSNDTT